MRFFRLLPICVSLCSLSWSVAEVAKCEKGIDSLELHLHSNPTGGGIDNESDNDEFTSDEVIEENPDYIIPPPEDSEDAYDSDSDDDESDDNKEEEEEEEEQTETAKTKVSKTLKKSKKSKTTGPLRLLRKNRAKITLVLTVFAFRNEIFKFLLYLLGASNSDKPVTNILKLLLFVDFLRRMQSGDGSSSLQQQEGRGSLAKTVGIWIEKALDSNPAYVPPIDQHFCFESLNDYYVKDGMALQKSIRNKHVGGLKWPSSSSSVSGSSPFSSSKNNDNNDDKDDNDDNDNKEANTDGRTVVVLDWTKLDEQITRMTQLRQEVSFLLSEYRSLVMKGEQSKNPISSSSTTTTKTTTTTNSTGTNTTTPSLEVVVLLESPGGSVSDYGLAGQHLLRLRNEPGITLTICVDKVAASGGYMLCCTASPGKLYSAPFAYLGSIGVIATQINVRKLLTNWGIQPLEYRGGKYKAPIGLLGKISKNGKRVTQTMVDEIHQAFKSHVIKARPILKDKIEEIGNGSVWLGTDALDLGLVDALKTSDEYIEEMIKDGVRVFKMLQAPRSGFLFGPKVGHYNAIESNQAPAKIRKNGLDPSFAPTTSTTSSTSTTSATTNNNNDDENAAVEDLIRKSKTAMLRLPAQAKSLFSKSLQSF